MSEQAQIFDSSVEMQKNANRKLRSSKYPWRDLEVGKSFLVKHHDIKYRTLNNYAARMGKKLEIKFKVIDHGEDVGYEVGRVA